ncbi:hypothetical protein [Rhizobium sp. BK068]|uniref:hypothetical protein n=1 Tax=Rhizobium sp. BK068 TaxID=2512130 RepID=UPI00104E71C5|nr:hypothetical protein [Rhizobium sp. BK068]
MSDVTDLFPDPFVRSILRVLADAGFWNTASEIARELVGANPAAPLSVRQQEQICAKVIQQNILRPFEAWEKIMLLRQGKELKTSKEKFLQAVDADGFRRVLGSSFYKHHIEKISKIVDSLKSGPEPTPDPDDGPDDPPDAPTSKPLAPRPVKKIPGRLR